ncbi:MAG: 3-oxoacyl-[acyl-carrier-protein] synthase [Gaiellales bacterium]|nr:3-oxoacyl-[acyl-carrier-protein] synthase [Gaiellales bacterium]MDX6551182.1 3-oxoacyl-[acyl-carrier-protein] synthase [Gaiellales bacterium]
MRRAVITGLGAVTPVGNDVPTTWANLVAGVSGVDVISRFDADEFPVNIAAEVKGFDATATMPVKEVRKTGLDVQYGVAAAIEAARDAEYEVTEPSRAGVIIGSAVGGLPQILEQQKVLETRGRERVSPHWLPNMLVDSTTSHVATQLGMRGVNYAIVSACASGSHAIGDAALVIRRGQADAVLAGGTESAIVPLILAGFCSMRALADGREDPTAASRPFDATRSGFVMAEGAAVVMVEDMEHALRRGARIYCEVIGYGASNDAYHVATPHPESVGVIEMMRAALGSAGISPHDIDYINAHGTSTPYNDAAETLAIKTVFGDHASQLAVSSIKSMIGHLFGAAGAIEALATALTIHHGVIPPTINYRHPDPECDLDYVPNVARQADVKVALSNSMGLGGHNGCVILKKFDG